jgi:hypothetical protein
VKELSGYKAPPLPALNERAKKGSGLNHHYGVVNRPDIELVTVSTEVKCY